MKQSIDGLAIAVGMKDAGVGGALGTAAGGRTSSGFEVQWLFWPDRFWPEDFYEENYWI